MRASGNAAPAVAAKANETNLLSLLLKKKHINLTQMQHAKTVGAEEKIPPVGVLVREKIVNDTQIAEVVAESRGIPFIPSILERGAIPAETIGKISESVAFSNKVIPFYYNEDTDELDVAFNINNFTNLPLRDLIKKTSKARKVNVFIAPISDIEKTMPRVFRSEGKLEELIATNDALDLSEATNSKENDDFEIDEESRIVQFVKLLLNQAITDKASDIHIEPQEHMLRIRYRVDGVLHIQQSVPMTSYNEIIARIKILCNMDTAVKNKPQDGRLSVNHQRRGLMDMRVAALPTVYGEKIVLRILDNSQASLSLNSLGFSNHNLERFRKGYKRPYGMVLVTGPTGSGKSTTLYAALNEINTPDINIITVEDPVEYKINGINQVQINVKQEMTFPRALRSILRSDPDVVLIGEIRDPETAQIAIEAGQTGHLVLSTLHTNTSSQAITRLAEMGVQPFLVGTVVEAILAQRLVRKLCKVCKISYTPEVEYLDSIEFPYQADQLPTICKPKPKGCVECGGSGYSGRMGVHEVLLVDEEVEKMAVKESSPLEIENYAVTKQDMHTLKDDGWVKVLEQQTSIEEILRVIA